MCIYIYIYYLYICENAGKRAGMRPLGASIQDVAPSLVVANWACWVPAMAVNFTLIPLRYQVLFSNVVAMTWTVYVSYVSVQAKK